MRGTQEAPIWQPTTARSAGVGAAQHREHGERWSCPQRAL
jgi:hypothetical protein